MSEKLEYEVIKPWHGVEKGERFKTGKLHNAIKANVRLVAGQKGKAGLTAAVKPKDAKTADRKA